MTSRMLLGALALLLAGCGDAKPPAAQNGPDPSGDATRDAAELLSRPPAAGSWEEIGDGAITSAQFKAPGAPDGAPDEINIGCNNGSARAFLNWTFPQPTVNGELRVHTATGAVVFAAEAYNFENTHMLNVEVDGADPRLAAIKSQQPRLAFEGAGQAMVLPWDPKIALELGACAG
ncbi:MAG: hypothetical protein K2P95_03025 [Hyphomonadaceae bacterium]|nr:hypothetical protein [Hyphomonadaceae bacterium]